MEIAGKRLGNDAASWCCEPRWYALKYNVLQTCNSANLYNRAWPTSEIQTPAWQAAQSQHCLGDPNARGQQNESLAWFWSVEVNMQGPDQSWNEEFYQVHWLRAKALWD
ncbi:uncharacterized protein EDB93DRAFT_1081713 [Suillus bovinus]|uniref:uncharacterized protein n=1 Tax=Suillus bovinus TaxID=48563 RepID=UPI001B866202|nr:uncharacterized protein EDB93DRAFT_1081713 [Suillus bovinus]KAG2154299.1 hypothetical protein EDB93DRAFT_1081713 [Suillus bovinus]